MNFVRIGTNKDVGAVRMKGFKVYKQMQQLKEQGFTRSRVTKQLKLNRETVRGYWNMTADEFEIQLYSVNREQLLSNYEETIIRWLRQYPTMTAAQVCDWLKEHYRRTSKNERSADMSLHPKWQRQVVGDLKRIFPKVQFVATTHSPFIIQSLDEGELVTLDDTNLEDYAGASIEDISKEVMGIEMPQYSTHKVEMYRSAFE